MNKIASKRNSIFTEHELVKTNFLELFNNVSYINEMHK